MVIYESNKPRGFRESYFRGLEGCKVHSLQKVQSMVEYLGYNEKKIIRGFLSMKLEEKELKILKEDLVDLDENIAYLIQDGCPEDNLYIKELIKQRNELKNILDKKSGI